jgi:hypothetical protein
MKVQIIGTNRETFLKRTFYLLWQAIGHTTGMGKFQDFPQATEDDVWGHVISPNGDECYGDYVFGRMMKWGVKSLSKDSFETKYTDDFQLDYQGFSAKYRNNKAIFNATVASLGNGASWKEIV